MVTFAVLLYFVTLALWSATVAYVLLFMVLPSIPLFGGGKHTMHHAPAAAAHHKPVHHAPAHHAPARRTRFSAHEGFRSFAEGVELTVEDIVKGLARED